MKAYYSAKYRFVISFSIAMIQLLHQVFKYKMERLMMPANRNEQQNYGTVGNEISLCNNVEINRIDEVTDGCFLIPWRTNQRKLNE